MMASVDDYRAGFAEEPGYLDFAGVGPLAQPAIDEMRMHAELLARSRFASLDALEAEDERMRAAVAAVTGFHRDRIVFQPDAATGFMQVMFGLTGSVLVSRDESSDVLFALTRAGQALGRLRPVWLDGALGGVTPGDVRAAVTDEVGAVVVSLVNPRTGHVADLDGIRQVIGESLLIVDATQGLTVLDADYRAADVLVAGGHTWTRAGRGTGFLAMSDHALERIAPVLSGASGAAAGTDAALVAPPAEGVRAFSLSPPVPLACSRLAAALEEVASVGVGPIHEVISERVDRVIALADEYGIEVASPRDPAWRAGIVVLAPAVERRTALTAELHNGGLTVAVDQDIRVSVHVSTGDDTLAMLRGAFASYVAR